MNTTEEQAEHIAKILTAKGAIKCTACSCDRLTVGPMLSGVMASILGTKLGGEYLPMATTVCSNCSHVMMFAAIPLGVPGYVETAIVDPAKARDQEPTVFKSDPDATVFRPDPDKTVVRAPPKKR